jgi:DNA mismatch repair protein MLH3
MFNDELSHEQCNDLLLRLSQCAFPFQCAHGRPSIVPIIDLAAMPEKARAYTSTDRFGKAFKNWKSKYQTADQII